MPITITDPIVGGPFGPGFLVDASTDIVGPLPIDWRWVVELLYGVPGFEESIRYSFPISTTEQHRLSVQWAVPPQTQLPKSSVLAAPNTRVRIRLTDASQLVVIEEAPTVAIVPDWQSGTTAQLLGQMQTGGGFTATDRTALMTINTTVVPWFFWQLAGELLPELVNQLRGLVRTKPDRRQVDPDRIGEGFIPPPVTGTFFKWVGIEWAVVEAPPGFGLDDGNPDVTEIDWGQLTRRRAFSDGSSSPDETFYEKRVNASWYWGLQEPADIAYFIMPGIKVRFWWLIQLEPVVALANPH